MSASGLILIGQKCTKGELLLPIMHR
uniref:Uncharacterized protein n=1 Tax=Anguilla anguilla TaxID=7936 RepID=A0A0E9V8T9_ANGAN